MISTHRQFASSQKGFASILIVLLVGLALASSVLGTAYYLKNSQKSLVASHALTNAQSGAWTGVEVFRKYLNDLDGVNILALSGRTILLNVQGGRELEVNQIETSQISVSPEKYQVLARIQNISDASEASSTIETVYEITIDSGSSQQPNGKIAGINLYGDVTVNGKVHIDGGEKALINIQGNFSTTGNGFTGVDTLSVTGNVDLRGGGEKIKTIISNGNVYLGSGSEVEYVYAKGTVTIESGKEEGEIYADQDIIINNGSVKLANTLKNITFAGASAGSLIAGDDITISNGSVEMALAKGSINIGRKSPWWDGYEGSASKLGIVKSLKNIIFFTNSVNNIGSLTANGDININQNLGNLGVIATAKNLICVSKDIKNFTSLRYATSSNCPEPNGATVFKTSNVALVQESEIPVTGSTKIVPITEKTGIDAYNYKSQANYVFSQENNGAIIKVTLQNIENTELNGKTFYLGTFPYSYSDWGYLCKDIIDKVCQSSPVAKITQNSSGNGDNTKQITYSNNKWDINVSFKRNSSNSDIPYQPDLTPGIMFFEGDLDIREGSFINTFIATKNIKFTGAGSTVYAPNYVEKELICDRRFFPKENLTPNIYIKPANLCQATALDIGNIALLAGSYLRSVNSDGTLTKTSIYQGGNITLATAYIYGNIMAGNRYYVNNTGHVFGSITAENLLNPNSTNEPSKLFDTTVDLTKVDTSSNSNNGNTEPTDGSNDRDRAKIRWSRYI